MSMQPRASSHSIRHELVTFLVLFSLDNCHARRDNTSMSPTRPKPHPVELLHRDLRDAILRTGLRRAGRLLGDGPRSNTHAMRLHRMIASTASLLHAPFLYVYQACRVLGVPFPVIPQKTSRSTHN